MDYKFDMEVYSVWAYFNHDYILSVLSDKMNSETETSNSKLGLFLAAEIKNAIPQENENLKLELHNVN